MLDNPPRCFYHRFIDFFETGPPSWTLDRQSVQVGDEAKSDIKKSTIFVTTRNQSELKNEKTVSTSKAGNQLGINNKKITQSPGKISAPKGDTLIIQNKTIDNNMATTSYTSQETSNTSKQILNSQTPQIKKTYEKQARMYIKKHSIPDKYHNLILEYFMRLSEKSS